MSQFTRRLRRFSLQLLQSGEAFKFVREDDGADDAGPEEEAFDTAQNHLRSKPEVHFAEEAANSIEMKVGAGEGISQKRKAAAHEAPAGERDKHTGHGACKTCSQDRAPMSCRVQTTC